MKYLFFILFILSYNIALSQISIEKYQDFLKETKNYDYLQLKNKFSDDLYKEKIGSYSTAAYFDSVDKVYNLTYDEKYLLNKHGFVVTERLSYDNLWDSFWQIYNNDLPVFVSTDVILHCLHRSYDNILSSMEINYLIPKITTILNELKLQIPIYAEKYKNDSIVTKAIKDLDVFLTIGNNLLSETQKDVYFSEMQGDLDNTMNKINNLQADSLNLFSPRLYDYSQLKPRGHYTLNPELERYFKCMMWLGRTELYLTKPIPEEYNPVSDADIQKQVIASLILTEMLEKTEMIVEINKMDKLLKAYIGESDNVQTSQIQELRTELKITDISELDDFNKIKSFQDLLSTKSYADQKILSQIIWTDPMDIQKLKTPSAYLILGQRFILDSYILANLVHDKVLLRMLPNSLDALFTLGNNSALQFLKPEINDYKYAPNIAALRYLTDANTSDFWNSSLYNVWLNSLRILNPPDINIRQGYPEFMQTAAYWQQKMNTQLCSWAELRHDNLLYAKQSYSGSVVGCSYPYSYVEPFPELYRNISDFMKEFEIKIDETYKELNKNPEEYKYMKEFFLNFIKSCNNLKTISEKELKNQQLSSDEINFLKTMISVNIIDGGCTTIYEPDGWLAKMFYSPKDKEAIKRVNYVVADIHTSPTDDEGNIVGWVKHIGTGDLNTMIVNVPYMNGQYITFVGPVLSFNEYTSTNFLRLTDEEWLKDYYPLSSRPNFTELYLTNKNGSMKTQTAISLMTGVNDNIPNKVKTINSEVYPNPASNYAYIKLIIPDSYTTSKFKFEIYDLNGNLIMQLANNLIQAGSFIIKWDGTDLTGNFVKNGNYYYKANVGNEQINGKIVILK